MFQPYELFLAQGRARRCFLECVQNAMGDGGAHPGQGPILTLLMSEDGLSQADITRKLGVSAATVTVSVTRLERLGYVERRRNAQNRRAYTLTLTPEGRQAAERLHRTLREVSEAALAGFDEDEVRQLFDYFRRIYDNLNRRYSQGEEKEESCTKCSGT